MDDEEFLNTAIDPAQAAWAAYVAKNYFTRDCIDRVRVAYMAGWNERDSSAKAALAFKQGIIDDLSADVQRLEDI